jgi:hypothetical protein
MSARRRRKPNASRPDEPGADPEGDEKLKKENLVSKYGPFWARNNKNLGRLRKEAADSSGVYLLYLGWFPVYIGSGKLYPRIEKHQRSHSKTWDRFTWFALVDPRRSGELEAILLRSLPFYLRLNNKQGAHLPVSSTKEVDKPPLLVPLPKVAPKKGARKIRK